MSCLRLDEYLLDVTHRQSMMACVIPTCGFEYCQNPILNFHLSDVLRSMRVESSSQTSIP
jgi:hypothetical protein